MPQTDDLTNQIAALSACNNCAICHEVCPAFAATTLEADGARGRNRLIRLLAEGRVDATDYGEVRSRLATCMLCGACVSACPSGVPTDSLVTTARSTIAGHLGIGGIAGATLRHVLTGPRRFDLALKPLRTSDRLGLRSLLTARGRRRPPGRLGALATTLPRLPARSFLANLPAWRRVVDGVVAETARSREDTSAVTRRPAVAYFVGCLTNSIFPDVAEAVYGVLRLNGYDVTIPDIACCGAAHNAHGDTEGQYALARKNIAALFATGADLIVTDCATCARTLHTYGELLADDPAYSRGAAWLAPRVREACQLLVEGGFAEPASVDSPDLRLPVTYHDPCHLARGLNVRDAPRAVIKAIPGVELREMPGGELCCGGGAGHLPLTQPVSAAHVLDRKMAALRATGASLVLTACPGCMLQLGSGLRSGAVGMGTGLAHPCQLLWQAYTGAAIGGVAD